MRHNLLRNRRTLKDYLTGYAMIAPAVILIFTFGIFPVAFALYVSLFQWRIKQGQFVGLGNYINATGSLTYLFLFAVGIALLVAAILFVRKILRSVEDSRENPWLLALPGILYTAAAFLFIRWMFLLAPEVLGIADKIIGKEKTRELFEQLLKEAFTAESVVPAFQQFILVFLAGLVVGVLASVLVRSKNNVFYQTNFTLGWMSAGLGGALLWLAYTEVSQVYLNALETGSDPGIWIQLITITSGVVLLGLAWKLWNSAAEQERRRSVVLRLMAAAGLIAGGWLLIGEIPMIVASGDKDLWEGLKLTIFYAVGTIPFQLGISIFLAILLFQKLRGSELFRMLFFLPYVTPTVASAAVFRQLFSNRLQAPINSIMRSIGLEPQAWIHEPTGIVTMLGDSLGLAIPGWAAGPSLALVVVMIYSIWTFVGYDTVIYLAGLGNIPTELMEAAEIDGAGSWDVFRHITFPLLSPTTYFLTLLAVIGTFKAFNHIWVMKTDMSLGTMDTFSIVIFQEFYEKLRYGYASALAFVLFGVILALTYINNRIQGSRVFYG